MSKPHLNRALLKRVDDVYRDPKYRELEKPIHQIFIREWVQPTGCASINSKRLDGITHSNPTKHWSSDLLSLQ